MKNRPSHLTGTLAGSLTCRALPIAAALLLGGCAQKYYVATPPCEPVAPKLSYVVLIPSPDGSIGEVVVKGQKGEQVLNQPGQAGTLEGQALKVGDKQIKEDFGDAMAAQPKIPVRFVLYFQAGNKLTAESDAQIANIIAEAKTRPAVDVTVIGNTDTLRSADYNDELGLKRATKVAELLRQRGLKANSVTIESRGERNLLVQTRDETFEPKNRRCEISVR